MPIITDRDLLVLEPSLFLAAASAGTSVLAAADAATSGTTLTSATSDFEAAGVDAGHVAVFDGDALEVIARLSPTSLDVSRPRASADDEKIAPIAASDKTLKIITFARLIDQTQRDLLARLGRTVIDPTIDIAIDMITNPQPLADVLAMRTIQRAFEAAAAADPESADLAARASLFRERADAAAANIALLIDEDGDGRAEHTRHVQVAILQRN